MMDPIRIFISSVQREFAAGRGRLRDYLRGDPLMRRFFTVFLFEDVPAADRRPDAVYLEEVDQCDIYIGLFGADYGSEDEHGVSPTEREFDRATELHKQRLIFVRSASEGTRHEKMRALIAKAQRGLVRRRFATDPELLAGVYAALVQHLESKQLLRFGPFDAEPCQGATLDDLDLESMARFIRIARRTRQFPLPLDAPPTDLLAHLNLLSRGRLSNSAVLLFGKAPQRFLISSEVRCAHFHGTSATKPIPSYQVMKGTVFKLVDDAVDFVLSKINLSVGTRAESVQAPVAYEIPMEVVTEAIVNAVAHRDYTDNSSVQVMLYKDRLEVLNSGSLPPQLTLEMLRSAHQSVPGNPLLAEPMYLLRYIERMGTGTLDMIRRCAEAGLPEPEFEAHAGFLSRIWRPTSINTKAGPLRGATRDSRQIGSRPTPTNTPECPEPAPLPARILRLLRRNPSSSRRELAATLSTTESTVRYHLDKLAAAGEIERVGPDKGGRWRVLHLPAPDPNRPASTAATAQSDDSRTPAGNRQITARKQPETGAQPPDNSQLATSGARKPRETAPLPARILRLLRRNPSSSRRELAATLSTTESTVRYHLDKLAAAGKIERVGPDKGGRWRLLGDLALDAE